MNKKKITFIVVAIVMCLFCAVGVSVYAGLENNRPSRSEMAVPDTWYERPDAEKEKTITKKEPSVSVNDAGDQTESDEEEVLTYVATDGREKDNPLDVYEDENRNQYRYNQKGELETYRQGQTELLTGTDGSITKQQAIDLTWKQISQLYGERVNGFTLVSCTERSSNSGYDVVFGKTYGVDGFIVGARSGNEILLNGDFSYCTISDDLLEDFDSSLVKDLTQEQVKQAVVPEYEAKHPNIASGPIEVSSVRLVRKDGGFALQVVIVYEIEIDNGGVLGHSEVKDVCYYKL